MSRNPAVPASPTPELRTPSTLKSHIFHGLRDAIVSGRYRPGDRLNESKIAREFGISRIPVREALMQVPTEQRLLIELAYFQAWTQREIAEQLRVPIGTVKARTARGLRNARRFLMSAGHDGGRGRGAA